MQPGGRKGLWALPCEQLSFFFKISLFHVCADILPLASRWLVDTQAVGYVVFNHAPFRML